MNFDAVFQNIFSPPALFFALGLFAALVKSDLKMPDAASVIMGLFLLTAIGVRAGVSINESGIDAAVLTGAITAILLGVVFASVGYIILNKIFLLDPANAGSVAGHFGAVSAMTLVLSVAFLDQNQVSFEPFLPALYPFMDIAALITAILLARRGLSIGKSTGDNSTNTLALLREGFTTKTTILLLGGLIIGYISGPHGMAKTLPFYHSLFYGVATFYLLDLGLIAGARVSELKTINILVISYAIFTPVLHIIIGTVAGTLIGLSPGGVTVLAVGLSGGASYVSAPIVMRTALPQANPSLALTLTLVIAFPFNVIIGIPFAYNLALALGGIL